MTQDLIPVPMGPMWGYIDAAGKTVIPARFTWAEEFSGALAVVNEGGQIGFRGNACGGKFRYIDKSGSYAFEGAFDDAGRFSEGYAAVNRGARAEYAAHEDGYYSKGGKWGFIDSTGQWTVGAALDSAGPMREGLAPVRQGGKAGYLNAQGEFAIPPRFEYASCFSEGFAVVQVGRQFGFLGKDGQFLIAPRFLAARQFSEGLASGIDAGNYAFTFFDRTGAEQFLAPENTISAGDFSEGLCFAGLGGVQRFKDGNLYPIGSTKNYGYLDLAGKWRIPPQYDWASNFSDGLAWVRIDGGKHIYIRPDGSALNEKVYDEAEAFRNGRAVVRNRGNYSVIDRNGDTIWG